MKIFDWNPAKNQKLLAKRKICFEDVILEIQEDRLLDILRHPNPTKYENQKVFVIALDGYAYLVLFVEDDETIFLKTIIPSRKATKKYLL